MDEFDYEASIPLPIANPDLFGHAEAEAKFLDSFNSGRLPHAWLISGPPGIGKATLAYRIARFVLTRHSPLDKTAGLFGDNLTQTKPKKTSTLNRANLRRRTHLYNRINQVSLCKPKLFQN